MFYQVNIKASADADLVFGCPEGERFLYHPMNLEDYRIFVLAIKILFLEFIGRPKSHPSVFYDCSALLLS